MIGKITRLNRLLSEATTLSSKIKDKAFDRLIKDSHRRQEIQESAQRKPQIITPKRKMNDNESRKLYNKFMEQLNKKNDEITKKKEQQKISQEREILELKKKNIHEGKTANLNGFLQRVKQDMIKRNARLSSSVQKKEIEEEIKADLNQSNFNKERKSNCKKTKREIFSLEPKKEQEEERDFDNYPQDFSNFHFQKRKFTNDGKRSISQIESQSNSNLTINANDKEVIDNDIPSEGFVDIKNIIKAEEFNTIKVYNPKSFNNGFLDKKNPIVKKNSEKDNDTNEEIMIANKENLITRFNSMKVRRLKDLV